MNQFRKITGDNIFKAKVTSPGFQITQQTNAIATIKKVCGKATRPLTKQINEKVFCTGSKPNIQTNHIHTHTHLPKLHYFNDAEKSKTSSKK